jgi:cell division protein ZipA
MTPLQWALLIFGVVAVIAVYLYSRRDRRAMEKWNPSEPTEPLVPPVRERQLDIFAPAGQQFDEFGVGKPRRIAPGFGEAGTATAEDGGPAVVAKPLKPQAEKIISLLIAEREGTHILGSQLHEALRAEGLQFGARQIYHRLLDGEAVFSVASLLKPGVLDPAAAASFSTPGLTMFMVLPGPQQPDMAIRDMLATADRLARAVNAQVYDSRRKPLSPGAARNLQLEVEAWAAANPD